MPPLSYTPNVSRRSHYQQDSHKAAVRSVDDVARAKFLHWLSIAGGRSKARRRSCEAPLRYKFPGASTF
jgi:hypothetical protein